MHTFTKALMISIALIFDVVEAVLNFLIIGWLINPILTIIQYFIFMVWFWMEGVNFLGTSKAGAAMGITSISEMLPLLGSLPGLTLGVILTIRAHEEQLANKAEVAGDSNPESNVIRSKKRGV